MFDSVVESFLFGIELNCTKILTFQSLTRALWLLYKRKHSGLKGRWVNSGLMYTGSETTEAPRLWEGKRRGGDGRGRRGEG